jgi:tRNA dimethylallyltransferase
MKKKFLVICGPTATGKTKLAFHLAKNLVSDPEGSGSVGELVSADSRQVYKHMDIGTGKDIPPGAKWHRAKFSIFNFQFSIGYYEVGGINIWGYDLVDPGKEFSVAEYVEIVSQVFANILKRGKLPILVGGTGFYIKAVVDGIPTASVPKNEVLRKILKNKTQHQQFELLAQLDPVKAASLNASDRKNPRRLVRAIEIASTRIKKQENVELKALSTRSKFKKNSILLIGLKASKSELDKRIKKRVEKRVREGIEEEMIKLFDRGITFKHQSMQALGYKQWQGFFQNKYSRKEAINKWILAETQYAKRQTTWFKKDKRINWFDIAKPNWKQHVEKMVKRWYKNDIGKR